MLVVLLGTDLILWKWIVKNEEVLNSNIIDVIKTNRGGKTTYHGPGQRIVYFMLNLNNKKKDIRKFISIIEDSLITFLKFMDYCDENYKCRFFLATGKLQEEQIILDEILNSKFKQKCIRLDNLRLKETLPYLKNCNISICNDSSFSHLSAALGIPTIVLMADTPIIYGSYSPRMHPILPDGVKEVKHDTLGKDKINAQKIYEKFEFLIN